MLQLIGSTITALYIIIDTCVYNTCQPISCIGLLSYLTYDLTFNTLSKDFALHHLICMMGMGVGYFLPYPVELYPIVGKLEISTLILNFLPYANSTFKLPLQTLFYITFFKYRIYDWYYMFQEHTLLYTQIIPLCLMYTLNLYWFTLLTKKLMKPLKNLNLKYLQHEFCSYSMALNSCLIIYNVYPTYICIQITSCLLAITSYLYHQNMKIYTDIVPKIPKWITYDITAIHLFEISYIYNISNYWYIIAGIHLLNMIYIYKKIPEDYVGASLPSFAVDAILILYTYIDIEGYTVGALIYIAYFVQPFYDLTFSYIHLLVVWGAYFCFKQSIL